MHTTTVCVSPVTAMDDLTFGITIYLTQVGLALTIALFFHQFARLHDRAFLKRWAVSWVFLAVMLLSTALVLMRSWEPVPRIVISSVGMTAGYLQLVWILLGVYQLGWGRSVSRRQVWSVVGVVTGAATVTVVLTTDVGLQARMAARVAARCFVSVPVLLLAAWVIVTRARGSGRAGKWTLAVAFSMYACKQLHDGGVIVLPAGFPGISYGFYAQFLDIVVHTSLALGMVLWLMEEDRRRLDEASVALSKSEEQLRHTQKMEAVGQLAGGIAHDFNNLTMSIQGYVDMVALALAKDDPLQDDLRHIRKAAVRAASLTRQLLAFSRKQVRQPRVLDLGRVARDTRPLLAPLMGADVDIVVTSDPDLLRVRADPGQIEQILVNLAINARDAMESGGTLTMSVRNVRISEETVKEHAAMRAGAYVLLEVSDTGDGIEPALQGRVFEPFFTTKEPGKGTGLGLATVYGIVKQSDGNIVLHSHPGSGSAFRIYLPAVTDAIEDSVSDTPSPHPDQGDATVLLVEDDDLILPLLARALMEAGYRTLQAHDPAAALALLERHHRGIDLLVTDVVMPGMSGQELARRAKKIIPDLLVLFISGYPERGASPDDPPIESQAHYLQKPFAPRRLVAKVAAILDGVPDGAPDPPSTETAA